MSFSEEGTDMEDPSEAILHGNTETKMTWQVSCTAAKDRTCHIVDHLHTLNKLLCWTGLRLRELPEGDGQLAVVNFQRGHFICRNEQGRRKAFGFLAWLLKSHPCVTSLHANGTFLRELQEGILQGVLDGNSSLKSISIDGRRDFFAEALRKMTSIAQLEKLELQSVRLNVVAAKALSEALRAETLTVLDISVTFCERDAFTALMVALKGSSTLRELSVNDGLFRYNYGSRTIAFTKYLENSSVLDTLTVHGSNYDLLDCILSGMLINRSVSNLNLSGCSVKKESTCELLRDVLLENTVLRRLRMPSGNQFIGSHSQKTFDRWLEALAENSDLEYIVLPFSVVPHDRWRSLFETVATHRSLKEVVVEIRERMVDAARDMLFRGEEEGWYATLLDAGKCLEDSGAKHKVRFTCVTLDPSSVAAVFSQACAFKFFDNGTTTPTVDTLKQFYSLGICRMIELRVHLPRWKIDASGVSQFIKETTTLEKLLLSDGIELNAPSIWSAFDQHLVNVWSTILESLSLNTSIREITVYTKRKSAEDLERLFEVVRSSKTIRSLNVYSFTNLNSFPRYNGHLPVEVSENYSLCSFRLLAMCEVTPESIWFDMYNTSWRNAGIVARAAHFVNRTRRDRRCALALKTVSRHPALMEELAEVLSVSDAKVASLIQARLSDMQGIHEFMRLAGVVKDRVTCRPRGDGRKQLHDLNEDCWRHVMRYVQLEDVRWSSETVDGTALP